MILDMRERPWRPDKHWAICGAEGIRTPDPLDAKVASTCSYVNRAAMGGAADFAWASRSSAW
jgi:hypothetical protein